MGREARAGIRRLLTGPAVVGAAAVAAAAVVGVQQVTSRDDGSDLSHAIVALPWSWVALALVLAGLALAHYVFAAVALRAVAVRPIPLGAATGSQLFAAAANRLVPNGLAGSGVNLRFLHRHGVSAAAATGAVATLGVIGGATDAAFAGLVTSAGPALGVTGAPGEFRLLAQHGIHAGHGASWVLLAVAVVAAAVFVVRRGVPRPSAIRGWATEAAGHLRAVARHPRNLVSLGLASMATTGVLAAAFVLTVLAVAHGSAPSIGALVALYLVGSAVGGPPPLPAVFGVTETVLVAGLKLAGLAFPTALLAVLVFRLITFWAPVPLGFVAGRRLRAAGLL